MTVIAVPKHLIVNHFDVLTRKSIHIIHSHVSDIICFRVTVVLTKFQIAIKQIFLNFAIYYVEYQIIINSIKFNILFVLLNY